MLLSLCREDLVRLSLSRRQWEWDEDQIQSRQLPDDVATFLASNISRLPNEVQTAVQSLSLFGASLEVHMIQALERQIGTPLIEPLNLAVSEGLLDKVDKTFRFGHDRVQVSSSLLLSSCVGSPSN